MGIAGFIFYVIGRKKNTAPFQALKSKKNSGLILGDVFTCSFNWFVIGFGAAGIVTHLIQNGNFFGKLMLGLGFLAFGVVGLIIYIVDRKYFAEFEAKRFYDVLAFAILGGLALTGIVLTILYFIR